MSDVEMPNAYITLPVYEGRIGNQVAAVAVSSHHSAALTSLGLTYWFRGDGRGRFPALRRTIRAQNQFGDAVSIHIHLHRLIALTKFLSHPIPSSMQEVCDELAMLPQFSVNDLRTPLAQEIGFDFRDENIIPTVGTIIRRNTPIVKRSTRLSRQHDAFREQLTTLRAEAAMAMPVSVIQPKLNDPPSIPSPVEPTEPSLRDLALSMTQDDLAALRPGDTAEDIAARRANRLAEPQSISDILRIASTTNREEVSRLTGKPLPSDAEILRAMTDAGLSAADLPPGFLKGDVK